MYSALDAVSTDASFTCSYKKITRPIGIFREECVRAAVQISKDAGTKLPALLLSGGADSEVLVLAFLEAGVPFKLRTFRFKHNLNDHELVNVQLFCKAHGLRTEFHDIDIYEWAYSTEAKKLFIESGAVYFTMIPHMSLISAVAKEGDYPVLGNGEVLLKNINKAWHYVEYEYDLAWYRHCQVNNIAGEMGFFQRTPELMLSALLHPRLVNLGTNQNVLASTVLRTSQPIKYKMYHDFWPSIYKRQKFDGGEQIRSLFLARETSLMQHSRNREFTIPYAEFIDSLT